MELINEIKKALTQITPGPWMRKDNEVWTVGTDKDGYHTQIVKKAKCVQCDYDLNFITAAPEWLAYLIELVEQSEKQAIIEYHQNRIEHWKQFRKEFKDGSYSLQESCEIRIDTHQVAINHINSLSPNVISDKDTLIKELDAELQGIKEHSGNLLHERDSAWDEIQLKDTIIESLEEKNEYLEETLKENMIIFLRKNKELERQEYLNDLQKEQIESQKAEIENKTELIQMLESDNFRVKANLSHVSYLLDQAIRENELPQ